VCLTLTPSAPALPLPSKATPVFSGTEGGTIAQQTYVSGPQRWFTAVRQDVRKGGQNGRSADEALTATLDPKPTLPVVNCRIAKGSFS
jgi:hypothetical protein